MSNAKEVFLRELELKYPSEEPEIQSCDEGETLDIMWDEGHFFISMTKEETFYVTYYGEFHQFLNSKDLFSYLQEKIGYLNDLGF